VIRREDGTDAWLIEGKEIATFGLNAVQGRARENWGSDPGSFDEVRPGTYDLEATELRDDEIDEVSCQNAAGWYDFDPFGHRKREECTVGALRARAAGVDTTPREYGTLDHTHNLAHDAVDRH
jgi:hypothetical protein